MVYYSSAYFFFYLAYHMDDLAMNDGDNTRLGRCIKRL